jgi:hypothetical protein
MPDGVIRRDLVSHKFVPQPEQVAVWCIFRLRGRSLPNNLPEVRFGALAAVSPGQDAIRPELGQMVENGMKISLKAMMAAGIGLGGLGLAAGSASAMPVGGLNLALESIESVRWVCDPYGGCQRVHRWRRYWGPWLRLLWFRALVALRVWISLSLAGTLRLGLLLLGRSASRNRNSRDRRRKWRRDRSASAWPRRHR